MRYTRTALPTAYRGVQYPSRLQARWAAFFDVIKWKHAYKPVNIDGWIPEFRVEFPCSHSECNGSHTLLAAVKPYHSIDQFKGHPCMTYSYGTHPVTEEHLLDADASAAFGLDPSVSFFEMGHGAGGGDFDIEFFYPDWRNAWQVAHNTVLGLPRTLPRG